MNPMYILSVFLPALALAAPSAEPSGHGHCQTSFKTIYTKECKTDYDKQCHPNSRIAYRYVRVRTYVIFLTGFFIYKETISPIPEQGLI